MLTLWFVTDWINEGFHSFLLLIDAVVYWFVSVCYNLFVFLATEPIFKEEFFTDFARRIYAILGVFMLFYLAYALLNALVDPEKLSKGDKSVSKLAMNLVISLILLGLSPTIFNYAYRLQNYILSSNLIGAIVMGSELEETNSITSFGDELSFTVMNTFINPENNNAYMGDNEYWSDYEESVKGKKHDYMGLPGLSKCVTKGCVIKSDDGSEGSNKKVITYYPFVSTGAGIFLIYIILSFTLDLGVRVFKFAFCQLLAPIPIVMRAMPGKKAQFDKWLKLTITVYLEVFVRVGCMYLAVYFIQALRKNITFAELFEGSKIMGMIALVILIMGVFSFAKQAPKMLSEMLGFDSGSLKLGIGEKLKAGGAFVGGAMIGAGITSGVNNLIRGGGLALNKFKSGNIKGGLGAVAKTFGSVAAGITSGGYNAFRNGKDATSFSSMKNVAGKGADIALQNREKRTAFYEANGGFLGGMEAHWGNAINSAGQWAGVGSGLDTLKRYQSQAKEVKDARKAVDDRLMAILNRDKNKLKSLTSFTAAGVGSFDNYADLLNEMEIMKSTGKTSNGTNVTAQMLTEMAKTEYNMKEQMKKDILAGYDLESGTGAKYSSADFDTKYDNELKELVTAYRTKSLKNASVISEYAGAANSADYLAAAVNAQKEELKDFVLNDDANKLYKDGNTAIKSATNKINVEVSKRIEKEQQNKK